MQLSKDFWLNEFLISQTAKRLGLDNSPTKQVIDNLKLLATEVLQPIRDKIGRPIIVTSGYRSPSVNRAVGGSRTSQHMSGQAADIICPGMPAIELCMYAEKQVVFDQLIYEFDSWCHISFVKGQNRKHVFTINRTGNKPGLSLK